ncbi:hypothetical protein P7K49_037071 [Saguinus oedipus]|uniref:Uncharacterized protein n=1 Tax=Saguinus oedipus TaxID=9490 RepID=A0ABQ9TLY0_SAGOE|nr:hypothetical protein P7K49_037071 [Saguinus oedipus]
MRFWRLGQLGGEASDPECYGRSEHGSTMHLREKRLGPREQRVDGDIPPRVKKDAHELILDFIRSRPPLKQVSERRLRPLPQKQRSLHEKILEEIKQERRLRPVRGEGWATRGFGSLPCILNACSGDSKSTSCINLSVTDAGGSAQRLRPRVLLKAPTLAEMEEMNTSEQEVGLGDPSIRAAHQDDWGSPWAASSHRDGGLAVEVPRHLRARKLSAPRVDVKSWSQGGYLPTLAAL